MNDFDGHDELTVTAARLRSERPEASALELDDIKRRVLSRRRPGKAASFARTRVAIIAMLVAGFAFSGAGAGLAVSGSSNNQASVAQYGNNTDKPSNEVLGETNNSADVQPERQVTNGVAAGDNTLPFTGFAAIPVLVLGFALLAGGLLFRRSARRL